VNTILRRALVILLLIGLPAAAFAQALPTTQPNFLQIVREEVKVGRDAEHTKIEAGWPAAFEKAKSPSHYLAMVSMTGPPEAWFVIPFESHAAMAAQMASESEPALAAELARLSRADAEVLNGSRTILARARKDLSYGAFPDTGKQRFWEITIFRVRPGREDAFAAAAKAYAAAVARAGADVGFRVYQVMAGMPEPTYLIFSSATSYADFDKFMAADVAIMKAFTPEDAKTFEKFFDGAISSETHRFRLSPEMSYVPKETRAEDPAFWMPKKPAAKPPAPAAAKPKSQQ
jgi:hypothetical protein